ncbi:MAG: ABC transporter substrate-binding protein [Lachnospiraceae bacterium]|nr:ABC transporter substrate-binding protein [Lachnospiraceae bacterium]
MTKRGQKFRNVLLAGMLLTLTVALSGCSGDKAAGDSTQIADTSAANSSEANTETNAETNSSSEETGEANDTADDASHITIGIPQDLDSLVPSLSQGAGTQEILFNIYEGLYKPDSEGNLVPAVASDYTMSEDGLVYTFTLREGILFHNGNPVTVADVKYSIETCAGLNGGEPVISAFSNIESVETSDDRTVVITLKESSSSFMAILATVEAAVVPADAEDLQTNPVGTGPYKFVSRSLQENVVLERFDEYWGEKANIKDITLKVLADSDSIVMNLQGGAVDLVARVSTAQAAELGDDFEVLEGTMNLVQAMYLNNAVEPFDNEKVRQALCYAVNKQEILDFVSEGKGTLVGSSMFPAFGKYYIEELNDIYTTDIDKAKELLTEAGYPDGFSFTMKVPSNYQQHVDTAQVVAEQLKQIGVTANIELIEWETWLSDVYQGRDYEATLVGVDASTLTAGAMLSRFRSDAHNNFVNFSSEEYDAAYADALAAEAVMDDDNATRAYKECETILAEKAANVYIQDMCELVAVRKGYTGYTFYPLYIQDFSKLDVQ